MFLRNIPVQITKDHPVEVVSIIPKATGDSLGRERDGGAGPAWPSGLRGRRAGVRLHIQSLERILIG